jgi:hypothetical protein
MEDVGEKVLVELARPCGAAIDGGLGVDGAAVVAQNCCD